MLVRMLSSSSTKGAGAVFALIIGINNYDRKDDFRTLRGAVNDTKAFEKYLRDPYERHGLRVPASNILLIENRKATRKTILSAFNSHFLQNPDIPDHGEATMIFYLAGHGSRIEAPENLMATDRTVDERTRSTEQYVYAIPDYVLGWLRSELGAQKGSNITVILDSCHSGVSHGPARIHSPRLPAHRGPIPRVAQQCLDEVRAGGIP
ncbi:hypothetical protein FB451DRAFT_707312 [Mycena latifolia]|nr:hypothetical protein FB451DRAFT_707312 [Mycena latifolia]